METLKIEIVNPKARNILRDLADLNLIKIRRSKVKSELDDLLERFRINADSVPDLSEITREVELVRNDRYEAAKDHS